MGIRKVGTIEVRGLIGSKGKIVVPGLTSLAAGKAFLTSIETAYMEGKGVACSYSETEKLDATIDAGNTDRKAIITYQDNDASTVRRISIPSWGTDAGDILDTPEGERVPLVACQSVVEALQTATGKNLTALSGYIIQTR